MTMIPTIINSLINLPKSERTFAVALVKLFRESVKKTLKGSNSKVCGNGGSRSVVLRMNQSCRSVGTILLVIFFAAGALICLVTMLALAFPGSSLEWIWRLKPEARNQFEEIGRGVSIVLMAAIGTGCGLTVVGLAHAAKWGRWLAIGILTANLIGDSVNTLLRHDPKTLIGLPIGGLMIWYLAKKKVSVEK
jgi:hypothetical protein